MAAAAAAMTVSSKSSLLRCNVNEWPNPRLLLPDSIRKHGCAVTKGKRQPLLFLAANLQSLVGDNLPRSTVETNLGRISVVYRLSLILG